MPEFDPQNPQSPGGGAFYQTGVLLSECAAFQRVSETADAAAALEKIVLGHTTEVPWDLNAYTIEQLETMFCRGHLYPPDEDDEALSSAAKSLVNPREAGTLILHVRRLAREAEVSSLAKRNAHYLWFFDEMEALRRELVQKSLQRECPRLRQVRRNGAPAYASLSEEVAQGSFTWCEFTIGWGDAIS